MAKGQVFWTLCAATRVNMYADFGCYMWAHVSMKPRSIHQGLPGWCFVEPSLPRRQAVIDILLSCACHASREPDRFCVIVCWHIDCWTRPIHATGFPCLFFRYVGSDSLGDGLLWFFFSDAAFMYRLIKCSGTWHRSSWSRVSSFTASRIRCSRQRVVRRVP